MYKDIQSRSDLLRPKLPGLAHLSLSSAAHHHSASVSLLEGVRVINLSLDSLNIFTF